MVDIWDPFFRTILDTCFLYDEKYNGRQIFAAYGMYSVLLELYNNKISNVYIVYDLRPVPTNIYYGVKYLKKVYSHTTYHI